MSQRESLLLAPAENISNFIGAQTLTRKVTFEKVFNATIPGLFCQSSTASFIMTEAQTNPVITTATQKHFSISLGSNSPILRLILMICSYLKNLFHDGREWFQCSQPVGPWKVYKPLSKKCLLAFS
jgi:hypothetical protein